DFGDLWRCEAVGACGADVQRELVVAPERGQDRERDGAAGAAVEARASPDGAPGVAGDEVLERGREVGCAGERAVDVLVAEHVAADLHACLVGVVAHGRCSRISVLTAAGCSTAARCAAGATSSWRAPGIASAIARWCAIGVAWSAEPEITSVGAAIRRSSARRSIRSIAPQQAA